MIAFDPKRIDRLAAKATVLEEQVRALVADLEELAQAARADAESEPLIAHGEEPVAAEEEPPGEEEEPAQEEEERAKAASPAPEGARLVALNMALRGTPRDETARYLREKYDFRDSDALLDDVYAKAGS